MKQLYMLRAFLIVCVSVLFGGGNFALAQETKTFDFTGEVAYGMTLLSGNDQDYNADPYNCEESPVTLTLKGNTRWWNKSGSKELRFYKNSSFEISVPTGYSITKIELTATTPANFKNSDETVGTYANGVWTGSSEKVSISCTITKSNTPITKIVVTYTKNGGGSNVTAPTLSLEEGTYTSSQTLTISADEGCNIYYTEDGTTPTAESTKYENSITIDKTVTIKAIAIDAEGNKSSVVTRIYTIVTPEFSFSASEATATIGEDFTAPTLTNTYEDKNVTYSSSDEIVATVDAEGKVTPLSVGTTTITATLASDNSVTASYTLTVKEAGLKTMTLSIDPAAGTYPAAPTVTLTSSFDEAKIYYTTNGTEPTTESAEYTAAIPVTISGTTVKALAVAEGYETARTEATYTIKPDQPKFSEESKTFKDPLAVTLTLPETASAGAKIHYAIGGTATAESDVYDGTPITISGKNDGDKIILHAVVVDEYGNVGTEKYCTYTYSDAIIFDFTANPNVWGIEPTSNNNVSNTDGKTLEVAGVVLTTASGTGTKTCIYGTSSYTLRMYKDGSITLTAPANYEIVSVKFTGNSGSIKETGTTPTISVNGGQWTGNAASVTFDWVSNCQIKTISVTLQKVADAPTSATLNFVAQNADGYYATFSSDKDVVFTSDVIVYAANVNGTAVKLNALASDLYEVTDATAGESGLLDGGYYVPANTGVLVYSMYETTTTYYFPAETAEVQLPANMLEAATADGVFEGKDGYCYYKLAYNDYTSKTDLGFYYGAADGAPFAVRKGLAYLAVPTTSGAAPARFVLGGDTDAISSVNSDVEKAETVIYTIAGQRVGTATKPGLYIVNGKKLIVK